MNGGCELFHKQQIFSVVKYFKNQERSIGNLA